MKVKELIRQLEQYDPEARVYNDSWMGEGASEILCCFCYGHNGHVILEDATQFDVGEEIKAMFEYYSEEYYDETDAYEEMIDRGYTPDIVAEYYNEESAKQMFLYCNSHGIDVGDKTRKYMEGKCLCEYCINRTCAISIDNNECSGTIEEMEECAYV